MVESTDPKPEPLLLQVLISPTNLFTVLSLVNAGLASPGTVGLDHQALGLGKAFLMRYESELEHRYPGVFPASIRPGATPQQQEQAYLAITAPGQAQLRIFLQPGEVLVLAGLMIFGLLQIPWRKNQKPADLHLCVENSYAAIAAAIDSVGVVPGGLFDAQRANSHQLLHEARQKAHAAIDAQFATPHVHTDR